MVLDLNENFQNHTRYTEQRSISDDALAAITHFIELLVHVRTTIPAFPASKGNV